MASAILAPHVRIITAPDAQPDTLRKWAGEADRSHCARQLPDDIVDHAPRLKAIVRHGVGLDLIPVAVATARGIAVANLPAATPTRLPICDVGIDATCAGRCNDWTPSCAAKAGAPPARQRMDSTELNASTLGILGVGTVGRRIAAIARDGFGMKLLGTSRRKGSLPTGIEEVALPDLFARSDAVVVCCALTDETRGIVNRDLLNGCNRILCWSMSRAAP